MADVEDETEFSSQFLDSMLEVEMTEEDKELDVSKNCDPLETFPPVPTFDLQSETLSYKDVYKNAISQPFLAAIPLPAPSEVPIVINPNSVLIYPGEVSPPKPTTVLSPVQKIPPKPNSKNPAKNTNLNNHACEEKPKQKFLKNVFKPEFVNGVFVQADSKSDISLVSEAEMKYYKTCFKDVSKVQNCRLHCTICDKHLGCGLSVEKKINVHSMLKVLTCKPCYEFYGDGNFPCDKGDNCEIYCRWCGQGGALVCCSFCPKVFCKKCVKRNYGLPFLKSIEKASDWACFCCAQKPLWPHRAICRALLEYLALRKTDPKASPKDTSSCCKAIGLNRRKLRITLGKNKFSPPRSHPKATPLNKTPELKNKTLHPPKSPKGNFLINPTGKHRTLDLKNSTTSPRTPKSNPTLAIKSNPTLTLKPTSALLPKSNPTLIPKSSPNIVPKSNPTLIPKSNHNPTPKTNPTLTPIPISISINTSTPTPNPTPNANIFSPRSILAGNTIIRGIATANPPKFISTFTPSQLPQTPVIHGETLITPPSRLLLRPKPPVNSNPTPTPTHTPTTIPTPNPALPLPYNSYVRVSLTHQAPNVDITKIPNVKIPHDVHGLVLRLIFPDNKMQYVRLTSDGSGCKASKDFPMPKFPEKAASFVEENLAGAFKVSKAMYEKLVRIREKVNSRTKFTEESVFNSSVKKLHTAYEKTIDLLKELDRSLVENHEEWKKAGMAVDVIEVSDDDEVAVKKAKPERQWKEKSRTVNEDSDIEIIEDVTVNGRSPGGKKYRLRSSSEQGKPCVSEVGVTKKRKKGRPRKYNKVAKMQNGRGNEGVDSFVRGERLVGVNEPEYDERTKSGDEAMTGEGEGVWNSQEST